MYRMQAAFYLLMMSFALLIQGCGQFDVRYHQNSPSEVVGLWDVKTDGPAYTVYAVDALTTIGRALLLSTPNDIDAFCPGYRNDDQIGRIAFWVGLASAVAKYESDFKSDSEYTEKFKNSKQERVSSRGLMQISLESTTGYGCQWNDNDELYDPRKNIECAIRVLSRLVTTSGWISGHDLDGSNDDPWLGGARYWHVLRPDDKLGVIRQATQALQVCQP